jgi:hypothetical protein
MDDSHNIISNINNKLNDRYNSYYNGLITKAEYLSHCKLIIEDGLNDYRTNIEYQIDDLYEQLKQLDRIEE